MAITISGANNVDKILATDGVLDSISGFSVVGVMTAPSFVVLNNLTAANINVGSGIQLGNAGVVTATTFTGNLTGNVNATSNLLLQIGGSEKFRVASSGQLGIGGANYGSAGQVLTSGGSGGAATWSTISSDKITEGNTEAEVYDNGSDGHFKVTTEGTERFRVTPVGTVNIGDADHVDDEYLSSTLKIQKDQNSVTRFTMRNEDSGSGSASAVQIGAFGNSWMLQCGSNANDSNAFTIRVDGTANGNTGTEKFRIKTDGKVGVNTTGPSQQFTSYAASGYPVLANGPSNGIGLGGNGAIVFGTKDLGSYATGILDASELQLKISGSNRVNLKSSVLLIGNTSSQEVYGTNAVQIQGTSAGASSLSLLRHGNSPYLTLGSSGGSALNSVTALSSGARIGQINFAGADGTDINTHCASISAYVDGSVSSNAVPGRLVFSTSTSTSEDERLRITSAGFIGIGEDDPQTKLDVRGTISTGRNVARELGTIINISANYDGSRVGGNVINGNKNYEAGADWLVNFPANANLTIDLGTAIRCDRFVIYNQNEYDHSNREVKNFTLEGSNDNSSWTTVLDDDCGCSHGHEPNPGFSFRMPAGNVYGVDDDEGVSYRYWKFTMKTFHGTDNYGGVMELELYAHSTTIHSTSEICTHSLVAGDVHTERLDGLKMITGSKGLNIHTGEDASDTWEITPRGIITNGSYQDKSTIRHKGGVIAVSSSYNSGDLFIRIDNIYNLPGNAWWVCGLMILSNEIQGGQGGGHHYVTSLQLMGLSSWNSVSKQDIVGSMSVSVSSHGSNFVELFVNVNDSSRGPCTVICNGGTFDPPRISFH